MKVLNDISPSREITLAENPFAVGRKFCQVPQGLSLKDTLKAASDDFEYLTVWVNGRRVPREDWDILYPEENQVIAARMMPKNGGSGNSKNIATLVVGVVLIAAATALSAGGGAGLFFAGTNIGLTTTQIALVGGALALSGITGLVNAVPSAKSSFSQSGDAALFSFANTRNRTQPYGLIPKNFGTIVTYPDMCAEPFTELRGNDQYLTQVFHMHGITKWHEDTVMIGDIQANTLSDVEMEFREGRDSDAPLTLYTNDIEETTPGGGSGIVLREVDGFTTVTTGTNTTRISLDLAMNRGAIQVTDDGFGRRPAVVKFNLEYAVAGSGSWITPPVSGTIKPLIINVGLISYEPSQINIRVHADSHGFLPGDTVQFAGVQSSDPLNPGPHLLNGGTHTVNSVIRDVFVLNTTFTGLGWTNVNASVPNTGTVQEIGASAPEIFIREETTTQTRKNFTWDVGSGQYDVRIRRVTPDVAAGNNQIADEVTFTTFRSIKSGTPAFAEKKNTAKLAIRMRANERLNGPITDLRVKTSSYYQVWNGSAWVEQLSNLVAWAYVDALTGRGNDKPLPLSLIDGPGMKAWADANAAAGQEFNASITDERTVAEMLDVIATAGRASRDIKDGKLYSVVRDVPQTIIRGHYSEVNTWGYSGYRTFEPSPHGLRMQFKNEDNDYQPDERIAYDDGYDETNATIFKQIVVEGLTNSDVVWKHGRYLIAQSRLRFEVHEFNVGVEHLTNTKGDLIRHSRRAALLGGGTGRIKAVNSGTSIVLDEPVDMESGNSYSIRIRTNDNTSIVADVVTNAGRHTAITLQSSLSGINVGDWWAFGLQGIETIEGIIRSIEPFDGVFAKLAVVAHAPGVHTAELGPIDPHNPNISYPPGDARLPVPKLLSLQSDEAVLKRGPGGSLIPRIIAGLSIPSGRATTARAFEGQIRSLEVIDGQWDTIPLIPINPGRAVFEDVDQGRRYQLRFRTLGNTDATSQYTSPINHLVIGKSSPPPNVTNFGVTVLAGGARRFTFAVSPKPIDLDGVEIRFEAGTGGTWESGTPLLDYAVSGRLKVSPYETADIAPGTYTFSAKAFDTSENESATASVIEVTLTQGPTMGDDGVAPATPTGLSLVADGIISNDGSFTSRIVADWDDNIEGDLDGYVVEFKLTGGVATTRTPQRSEEEFTGLQNGRSYECRVAAKDTGGNISAFTAWVQQTTLNDPGAPPQVTGLTAFGVIDTIVVGWDLSTANFTVTYEVNAADDINFMVNPVVIPTPGTAITDAVGTGKTRYYRVRALNKQNVYGNYSITKSASTLGVSQDDIPDLEIDVGNLKNDLQRLVGTPSQSIIINGGGEEGTVGQHPAVWTNTGGPGFKVATDQVRLGGRSLKISHATALQTFEYQDFEVKADTVYVMECWLKTDALSTGDAGWGTSIKVEAVPQFDFGFAQADHLGDEPPGSATPSIGLAATGSARDWTYIKKQFIPDADGTCRLVAVHGELGNQSGNVWFDEISVRVDTVVTTNVIATDAVISDKVATNTLVARNLIKTEALLTTAAQIQNALIVNAHLGTAIIDTANINSLQVTTLKIAHNAASEVATSSVVGPINLPTDETFGTILSFVYNSSGEGSTRAFAVMNIDQFGGNQGTKVTIQVKAGGTLLKQFSNSYGITIPISPIVDGTHNPVAGNITYTVVGKYEATTGGTPDQVSVRDITLQIKESLR